VSERTWGFKSPLRHALLHAGERPGRNGHKSLVGWYAIVMPGTGVHLCLDAWSRGVTEGSWRLRPRTDGAERRICRSSPVGAIGRGRPGEREFPTALPDTVETMPEWKSDWTPRTVGEAREYLDVHERDGDPEIVRACEALVDATPQLSDFAKAPIEQLEERGAD
jgi:hypothetical protein